MSSKKLAIALIQLAVSQNKEANIKKACQLVSSAAKNGAQLVCLPECFNIPYGIQYLQQYAEPIPGQTSEALSECAKFNKIYLVGGSCPEKYEDRIYNTCLVYGPNGELLAKHRKVPVLKNMTIGYITHALYMDQMENCLQSTEKVVISNSHCIKHSSSDLQPQENYPDLFNQSSCPEKYEDRIYNTCLVYGPNGELLAKHRKVHLFDIDIPGKITFKESTALSAGNELTTFQMPQLTVGLGICYDVRFPLMANIYAEKGCQLLIYPGAFNMTTGPAHWELLARARATDNQLFVAMISPSRDETASYVAWGHSMLVNPWGEVLAKADEKEQTVYGTVDLQFLNDVRQQIPITKQKRADLYSIVDKKAN